MWLILPLVYVLAWRQTGSLRQGLNGTVGWILGYAVAAATILVLDVGGYDGISATPDSPGAALAILGGFVGMWISNIRWRRQGGDPPRQPGKWERAFRATFGGDEKQRKPSRQQQAQPAQQVSGARKQPMEAQYRIASESPSSQRPAPPPRNQAPATQRPPSQSRPAGQGQRRAGNQGQDLTSADKYAKATGRALGAMFRGKKPPPKRKPGPR